MARLHRTPGPRASRPLVAAVALGAVVAIVRADDPKASRAKFMSEAAHEIRVKSADDASPFRIKDEPIYRYSDPTRSFSDGSLWAFGPEVGRPAALLSLSLEGEKGGNWQWIYEFTSLSAEKVRATGPSEVGYLPWTPEVPGIEPRPIPQAEAPASDAPKRLRQMRDLARRFRADETFEPKPGARPERYELRLLPQPVLRYSDPEKGLVDGAGFLFAYGQNPEIVVLIEARKEGAAAPSWSYGLGRISAAASRVRLDDAVVGEMPRINDNNMKRAYAGFSRPVPAGKE